MIQFLVTVLEDKKSIQIVASTGEFDDDDSANVSFSIPHHLEDLVLVFESALNALMNHELFTHDIDRLKSSSLSKGN